MRREIRDALFLSIPSLIAAAHMSAFGTSRHPNAFSECPFLGGKADIGSIKIVPVSPARRWIDRSASV